jgi:hypothetical protein
MRATIATSEELEGCQRKIAWFNYTSKGIYFETGRFFMGSHTSYHVDGNVFRTSPATQDRPRFQGRYLPIADFSGWYQAGVSMIERNAIIDNSCLKSRDRKQGNLIWFVSLKQIQSNVFNIVVEFVESKERAWLDNPEVAPPSGAIFEAFEFNRVMAIVTLLVREDELLVRPLNDGFKVFHHNTRFSLNQKGVQYSYEAYDG